MGPIWFSFSRVIRDQTLDVPYPSPLTSIFPAKAEWPGWNHLLVFPRIHEENIAYEEAFHDACFNLIIAQQGSKPGGENTKIANIEPCNLIMSWLDSSAESRMMDVDPVIESISCWPPVSIEELDRTQSLRLAQDTKRGAAADCVPLKKRLKLRELPRHEMLASVALARWWRSKGHRLNSALSSSPSPHCNPNTMLKFITKLPQAKEFMETEVVRLQGLIDKGSETANIHAALGSFLEKLDKFQLALQHLQKAVKLDDTELEYSWLAERVSKQIKVEKLQQSMLKDLMCRSRASHEDKRLPDPTPVERRSAQSLDFKEFFFDYALAGRPLVITGLVPGMTTVPWDLQHIIDIAGSCQVTLKRLVPGSVEWAQLEDAEPSTIGEFVDRLAAMERGDTSHQRYLFDWSLPLHCPALAQQLSIPKYFAGDFLQRSSPGSLYHDSWPSLFIAPRGLHSELHVDAFGSNFWMALFEGKKRWVFFGKEDLPLLYPRYDPSMDPVFGVDLADPDLDAHPLLSRASPKECILQPGELLFIPAGCPHRVENLERSLAVSANFVDLSNLGLVKRELGMNALLDERAADLLRQLEAPSFCSRMTSDPSDVPWQAFKAWPKDYKGCDY